MNKSHKSLAVVLSKKDWKEADLLFSLYSKEYGKISVLSIGAKKILSKLSGHLALPAIVEIDFIQGKLLKKLTHAYLIEKINLKSEEDYNFVSAILEIIDRTVKDELRQSEIWELLVFALRKVVEVEKLEQKKLILNIFILKLLQYLGYQIKLDENNKNREINRGLDPSGGRLVAALQDNQNSLRLCVNAKSNERLFEFLLQYLRFACDCDFRVMKSFV